MTATQIRRALSDVGMTEADPWVWVTYYHTPAGTGSRHGLLVAAGHIVGQQKPRLLDVTTAQTWEERLKGFRFELVGRIITQQELEAEPCPFWGLHVPNPGDYDLFDAAGLLRVAVWRWRAIHVEANVFAQVDWRPGWDDEERSYGGVRVGAPNDTTRAELGLAIIQQHQLEEATRRGPRPMSDGEAFEQAVTFGIEWLKDNPTKSPSDFGRPQFAAQRCTGLPAANRWMTEKHFGIKRVQRELTRRRGRPA